jgi:pimeloyl-ACP methyl ester carboxylesterase
MSTTFETITSPDGTKLAVDRAGAGPAVVLVGGAFNDRSTVSGVAAALAPDFTTFAYDRRGRGDSTNHDTSFSVDREFEDLAAVIDYAGGSARVFGHSSGAVLVLEAAHRGLPIDRLAVYEPPFITADAARPRPAADFHDRVRAAVEAGDRDEAVALFQTEGVGLPPEMIEGMRASDVWGWLTALAHTLPYDVGLFDTDHGIPADRLATITAPTLAITGSNTFPFIIGATAQVAAAIPGARFETLEGEDHGVLQHPKALRPLLASFFA